MIKFFAPAAALAVMATTAFANPSYTLEVNRGGVSYSCSPNVEVIDGVPSRRCVRAGGGGGNIFEGGLASGAGIGLGVLGLVVLASAIDDDDDTTNGTTD